MVAGRRSSPGTPGTGQATSETLSRRTKTSCRERSSASESSPREKVRQAWGSRSTTRTLRPNSAEATPSEWTVVVLATPPFWLATASTSVTREVYACPTRPRRGSETGRAPHRAGQADPPQRPQERRREAEPAAVGGHEPVAAAVGG